MSDQIPEDEPIRVVNSHKKRKVKTDHGKQKATRRPGPVGPPSRPRSAKSSKMSTKKLAEAQISKKRMGPKSIATDEEKHEATDTFHGNIISANNLISKPTWKNISTILIEFGGDEENCGRNTINDLFKRTRTNRRKASNAVYMIMLNANKDYPANKQRFLLNKKKEPLVRPTPPSVSVPGPSHQNMLGFVTLVNKPTKSGLSHAVLYYIGMQAIYNCQRPFDEVVESEVFKMSITPELARFAKVDNPSELDINLVKSEVRSLISMSAVGDSYFQTH